MFQNCGNGINLPVALSLDVAGAAQVACPDHTASI